MIVTQSDIVISDAAWPHSCQGLISRSARQYPDKTALTFKDRSYTYRQLIGTSNQLAALLLEQTLQPGDIVALVLDRSPEMLIALLAIMRSGASYLPIDPEYPKDLIEFMLEDSSSSLLLTSRKYADHFRSGTKELYIEDCWEKLPAFPQADPLTIIDGAALAYTLYTSGSTGRPKGVQIENHSLTNFLISMQQLLAVTPLDRLLAVTTICFDISGLELFLPLISGAELVLTDTATARDARMLLDILRTDNITMMQATPSTWKLMLDAGWDFPLPLRIMCGGEAMTNPLADSLTSLASRVWNLYGPTETTIWSTIKEITPADTMITIGWPIANTRVHILDEQLRPMSEGLAGEIYIAGEGVARGYLKRAELNAERFVANPFANTGGERMYRTGDMGTWLPDGQIQLHGRIDLQIKIRGFRIEPGEVEAALLRHPAIKEAVVKGKDDQLAAYIIPKEASLLHQTTYPAFSQDLRQALRLQVPEYMIPDYVVVMDKFPLTSNGKIDRKALPDPHEKGIRHKTYVAPGTAMEKLVAQTWSDHLHLQQVGLYDDYFEMGGNSISALRIMTHLENQTGKRLPLSTLFKAPTVEKLSRLLDADVPGISWEPLVLVKPGTSQQALYIVQGHGMNVLGFNNIARHMHPDQTVYGFQPKGLNGLDPPSDTIGAMAADYIAAILQVDQKGPYCLAGYSYGGVVAFEMAKMLVAKGKQVAMLAIIDTYANALDSGEGWKAGIIRKTLRQLPKFRFVLRNMQKHPKQTLRYQRDFLARKTKELVSLFHHPGTHHVLTPEERIDEQYAKAYEHYRMSPYDGSIELFRVKARLYFLDDMEYMGWRSFVMKEITIHEVSGDHQTFLLPPNDQAFAVILQRTMDQRLRSPAI